MNGVDGAFRSLDEPGQAGDDGPIPSLILDKAIDWYVRLASGLQTPQEQETFKLWHGAHPDHARAWQRLHAMGDKLQSGRRLLPPPVMRKTLAQAEKVALTRRRVLKTMMWAGTGASAIYLLQDQRPWPGQLAVMLADVRTARGERREIILDDGTRLILNTATGVDIRFDSIQRRIELRAGEIMVATAPDPAGRPFIVATADGSLAPIGTRFIVRRAEADAATHLAVTEGTVEVRVGDALAHYRGKQEFQSPTLLVHAGQQTRFSREAAEAPAALDQSVTSWVDGVLTAERMRLGDFIAELGRYRPGHLGCDPAVAGLRLTGSWPLGGPGATDRILASLENTLPVKTNRLTRYWVTVAPL